MGVTAPAGFRAGGVAAGIKSSGGRDLALVINDGPQAASAGVFTSNRVCAAPVRLSRTHMAAGPITAVILNSGGANACTGQRGQDDAVATAQAVADGLDIPVEKVAVASTGLIGLPLPMDALLGGIPPLIAASGSTAECGADAADAIRTTDTVSKTSVCHADGFTVGGMAKGAGMLAPGLATMLSVITTDAIIDQEIMQDILTEAVRTTFNRIDSDGCMSTNDTLILMASGASGIQPEQAVVTEAVRTVCADLARQLIGDAEGATHDIAVNVHQASSEEAALVIARAVARSNLFKAAVFGNDPNWGRVLSEVGTIPEEVAPYNPNDIDVAINGVMVCRNGGVGEDRTLVDMTPRECQVDIYLKAGETPTVTIWTNDLTHDYVHENSAYSS
ncbi:MAG: bifunctional glutamate N-acetyltransferase/amino-acid acetyltransferase ArgJ [Actinomycetaceae bacterium]|nr:bifunctional glutamate N-acetyltransferase/amino-acid acetyltransferase ArgJ [Actinomycetaceae bacterium]